MTTIRLATQGCPAASCPDKKRKEIIYWNHSCGSNAYLDSKAFIHCYSCNKSWKILNSQFKCEKCHNYSSTDLTRLSRILCALSNMDDIRTKISDLSDDDFENFLNSVVSAMQ